MVLKMLYDFYVKYYQGLYMLLLLWKRINEYRFVHYIILL